MAQTKTTKPAAKGATKPKATTKAPATTAAPNAGQTTPPAAPAPKASLFDQAVGFVLQERIEGGYVNDPRDPGGETNFGISKRSYPKRNIANLTRDQAIQIYRTDFWNAAGCEDMPPKLAIAAFDCAVNQGVTIAKRLIQKAVGVKADGIIGPVTKAAIARSDEHELVLEFISWRLRRYAFTANAATYMRGWSVRSLKVLRFVDSELEAA